jgi:Rad3-related DNA helicase
MKMLISLIQMAGRCTRSVTDESSTYILDGATVGILKKNWSILPQWFKSRLV